MKVNQNRAAALESLFREAFESLCRYVYGIVGSVSDARDVVQETFVRLCEMEPGTRLENALAYRIAHNIAIDLLRKRHVRENYSAARAHSGVLTMPPSPEQLLLETERHHQAEEALDQLNPKQRECLRLRGSGLSYQQIGTILDMSPDSVGPTLARGLRCFHVALSEGKEAKKEPNGAPIARRR